MRMSKPILMAAALSSVFALGACAGRMDKPVTSPAVQNTKAGKVPAAKAPGTLPSGRRVMGRELAVKFRGRRTRFNDMHGRRMRVRGWRVRGDTYCARWPRRGWRCYEVYQTGRNRYTLWFHGRVRGHVSIH